ncbi:hypothetical protein FEM48_Zijuj04G0081100 [Ziziphus jujuba var. spinosa]|uniref:Uncharacterized protein n=1 Tax=Ziziphus jujuba var. spinosa TaxID=714518 RepID=A0A978VIR2_ZIZJJ|nr:hypothetical protein FEM48_Zijuj04G0081100 [Ziziphus jujuba var. spinosa]
MPKLEDVHTRWNGSKSVAETLARWKEYNDHLDSSNDDGKAIRRVPAKGSKKGCMKGSSSLATPVGSKSLEVCGANDLVDPISADVNHENVIHLVKKDGDRESE